MHREWLTVEFNESRYRAYQYINFFEKFVDPCVNNCLHLEGISQSVLLELGAPSTSDEIVEEVLERKEAGENPTGKLVKDLKAKEKENQRLLHHLFTETGENRIDAAFAHLGIKVPERGVGNRYSLARGNIRCDPFGTCFTKKWICSPNLDCIDFTIFLNFEKSKISLPQIRETSAG